MKKMKKKYRWILVIPIIILMIYLFKILLAIYDYDYKYGYRFPERKFFDNQKNEPYSQNIPLHEMNFECYYYPVAIALGLNEHITYMIELPCDINYYERKEDSVPVLTLKKGTEVCVYLDNNIVRCGYGYGMQCWPDYEEEWRYGYPFFTEEDIPYDVREHSMYYVKSSQLRKVAKAYYQVNKEYFNGWGWSWEVPKRITEAIDIDLYLHGAFCPERWKHFSVWRQSRYEALNKIRRKIPL